MTRVSAAGQPAVAEQAPVTPAATWARRLMTILLIIAGLAAFLYAGATTYMATLIVQQKPLALSGSPADYQVDYRSVVFPARDDHLIIHGWFIPGVLPNGQLTAQRAIIMLH